MASLSVVIVSPENEQRSVLQMMVDATAIAQTSYTATGYPVTISDVIVRRIQDLTADVILMDIPAAQSAAALRAIELLHNAAPWAAIMAIGDMKQPQTIVGAMRGGAREYLERPPNVTILLEAFARLLSSRRTSVGKEERGRIFTILNAKGGSGATTLSVNVAMSLQQAHGRTALVDLAPLGNAALHLNVKSSFGVADALRNLDRLDRSLLEGFMTHCAGGLQLLAGLDELSPNAEPHTADFAHLFDLLATSYQYVVVDASSRLDRITRLAADLSNQVLLIAQPDVASLWSAAKIRQYLSDITDHERLKLVLNRFRKIPGFSESETETATGLKILWKVPNQYHSVAAAIDRGEPVAERNSTDIARSFASLASLLAEGSANSKRKAWSLFKLG